MKNRERDSTLWAKLEMSKSLAAPFFLGFDKCLAYTRGDQRTGAAGREQYAVADSSKTKGRVTVNQILNIYRMVCAKLVTDYPAAAALPASVDADDVAKAQASEEALRWFWEANNMRSVLRHTIQWLVATGTAALRTRWDTKKKTVVVDFIRPYDLRFEPYCNDPDESSYIGVVQYVRKEEILENYPEHAEELKEFAQAATRYYTTGPRSVPDDRFELVDVYHRDGKHEVWAGGVKVFETRTPGDRLPVQVMRYTEVEGYLWGLGLVEPLLESQDLYNSMRTQILKNAKLTGNPKILVPEEGGIAANAFSDKEGEKVKFSNGAAPSAFAVPALSAYVVAQPAQILSEMYDQAGVHGATLGKRVMGVTSAVAMQENKSSDAQQLQLTMDAIENAVKQTCIDVLVFMKSYMNEAKMVRMLDRSGKLVWSELNGTRLLDDPEVFIEAGSLFRSEAQDRDNRTLEYMQLGLLTKEQAKQMLSSRLEPLRLLDQLAALQHAQQVLEAVSTLGSQLKVYPTDNLEVLESTFKQYMARPDFYALAPANQDAVDNAYAVIVEQLMAQRSNGGVPMPKAPAQAQGQAPQQAGQPGSDIAPVLQEQDMAEALSGDTQQAGGADASF